MKKKVTFLELNLLSRKEQKAIQVDLNHPKILLHGTNNTGKSVIIRHLFWCLGLNPINIFSNIWDHNITGLLRISFENTEYIFYRNKENRYLFKNQSLLYYSDNNSEWNSYLAEFFNYPLKLLLKSNQKEKYAGLDSLLVPYFIEQDTGWGLNWSGPFVGLVRFKDFYKETLSNFTGLKSIESISIKQNIGILKSELNKLNSEIKIYEESYKALKVETKYNQPRINKNDFREEIKISTNELKNLIIKQKNLKNTLSELIQKKFKLNSILKSSIRSFNEISLDINFLDEHKTIECPTCGTLHEKTIDAITTLEIDYSSLENNIQQLKLEIFEINKKIPPLNSELVEIDNSIENFNNILKLSKSNISFQDIVDVEVNKKLSISFRKNTQKTITDIKVIKNKIDIAEQQVKALEAPEIKKEIKQLYEKKVKYNLNQLNIPFNGKINQIHSRLDIGGGSSNPRAILALHMSYLELSFTKTNLTLFPFVVDTPQQNGQDMNNLSNTFNHLDNINFTQLIVGSEVLPVQSNFQDYKIIELNNEYSVLNESDFEKVNSLCSSLDTLINVNIEI